MTKGWTQEECRILQEHYPDSTTKQLMELLPNRTESAIYRKRYRLGLVHWSRVSEEEKDYIAVHFYTRGLKGIAEDLDVDQRRVQKIAQSIGLYKTASRGHRPPDEVGGIDLSSLDEYGIKYLAMILDTKGLMTVYHKGKNSYQIRVGISTRNPRTAKWLTELGGNSRWYRTSVWRSVCRWAIENRVGARILLKAVVGYLKLNRANAEAILSWLREEIDNDTVVSMTAMNRRGPKKGWERGFRILYH